MSVIQGLTTSFKQQLLVQGQNFSTDTFKIALYLNPATLDYTTAAYSTTNEIVAPGYTAGGQILTGATIASSGNIVYVTFSNAVWAGAITANCALIYNSSRANASVAVLDFGAVKASINTFVATMPPATATTALLRF
jgi:hypothetical protein